MELYSFDPRLWMLLFKSRARRFIPFIILRLQIRIEQKSLWKKKRTETQFGIGRKTSVIRPVDDVYNDTIRVNSSLLSKLHRHRIANSFANRNKRRRDVSN